MPVAIRWSVFVVTAAIAAAILSLLRIPAALLIGPMAAAVVFAASGRPLRVPPTLFTAAQAMIGMMVARVFTAPLFAEATKRWPLFLAAVVAVLAAACMIGFVLTRWRVLPGTTALWGSFPGAATTMVLMAGEFGADARLVAFMQYLRVLLVAVAASVVARLVSPPHATALPILASAFPPTDGRSLVATLAAATVGMLAGRAVRLPAAALLGPMVLGALLQGTGWLRIELPPAVLASAYAIVGTTIGLRFDRATVAAAARSLPAVAACLVALVLTCALMSSALVRFSGVDPLTAYLAMSPGGADSVAIIAASSNRIDLPFVMAMQVSRFALILLLGPTLARRLARWAKPQVG